MARFGSLVSELNTHRRGASVIRYLYVGQFRKLWMVFMLVFMQKNVFWSIVMVNFQAVLMVLVVGDVKPYKSRSDNNTELMNEFTTLVVNYHLMVFTDFVPDIQTREQVGKSLVYVIGGNLLLNLGIVFGRSFFLLLKRAKLRFL